MSLLRSLCNSYVRTFICLCNELNVPVSNEKTEWANELMVFLGILLDGRRKLLAIPDEKLNKAVNIINRLIHKNKATVKELQSLAGLLNFINRAIVPGRVFTRRMYEKFSLHDRNSNPLKHYHHVKLDSEFKQDCRTWKYFLNHASTMQICRPFVDLNDELIATELNFYTDSSKSETQGFGCVFGISYTWGQWPPNFVRNHNPSIEYLELFALCIGVLTWSNHLINTIVVIFCDNHAVVQQHHILMSQLHGFAQDFSPR